MALLLEGHENVELTPDDLDRLITWMDANALFYGTFDIEDQKRATVGRVDRGAGVGIGPEGHKRPPNTSLRPERFTVIRANLGAVHRNEPIVQPSRMRLCRKPSPGCLRDVDQKDWRVALLGPGSLTVFVPLLAGKQCVDCGRRFHRNWCHGGEIQSFLMVLTSHSTSHCLQASSGTESVGFLIKRGHSGNSAQQHLARIDQTVIGRTSSTGGCPVNIERWGWYSIAVNVVLGAINLSVAGCVRQLGCRSGDGAQLRGPAGRNRSADRNKTCDAKIKGFPYGLYKTGKRDYRRAGRDDLLHRLRDLQGKHSSGPLHEPTVNLWMLSGLLVAIVIPLVFSQFELRAGQAANSPALIADAKEYKVPRLYHRGLPSWRFSVSGSTFPSIAHRCPDYRRGYRKDRLGSVGRRDAGLAGRLAGCRYASEGPRTRRERGHRDRSQVGSQDVTRGVSASLRSRSHWRSSDLEKAETATRHIQQRVRQTISNVERVLVHAEPEKRTPPLLRRSLGRRRGNNSASILGRLPTSPWSRCGRPTGLSKSRRLSPIRINTRKKAKGLRVSGMAGEPESGLRSAKEESWRQGPGLCLWRTPR